MVNQLFFDDTLVVESKESNQGLYYHLLYGKKCEKISIAELPQDAKYKNAKIKRLDDMNVLHQTVIPEHAKWVLCKKSKDTKNIKDGRQIIKNAIVKYCGAICIDEVQDIDKHMQEIIEELSGMGIHMILMGDPKQDLKGFKATEFGISATAEMDTVVGNSIVTPSLLASILNVKYVNSSALHRIEQEFQRNGVNISRQTMSNWIVKCSQMYFTPFVERMKQELLSLHVTQSDETPTQVIADSDHPNSKCYMWVHRSGEFYTRRPIVVYEYQKGRDHQKPLDFYKDYKGVLVTDSLQQYHLVDKKLPDVTNANCWAHARRDFADAVKAADKKDPSSVRQSVAYQALQKIAEFYNADTELKGLSSRERLQKRQEVIKPMVEEFFAWVKQQVSDCTVPPKSKTGQGLNFVINQEKYLQIFLEDGNVPIDNSASERAIRTFCLGKKNWMFHNTAKGASASAMVYSISETAKLNQLRPYYYFKYILTELPKLCEEKGNIDPAKLDHLMPWSDSLPDECRKPRRP